METPIGDDEDSHLGDFIEDSNSGFPAWIRVHRRRPDCAKWSKDSAGQPDSHVKPRC